MIICCLLFSLSATAQTMVDSGGVDSGRWMVDSGSVEGVSKKRTVVDLVHRLQQFLDEKARKKVDPGYIEVPEKPWRVIARYKENMVDADCWNEDEGLCTECAPREASYVAKARNEAMRRNIDEAAESATVWQGKIETRTTVCRQCGKPAGNGKFCNHCGAPLGTQRCPNCGAEVALGLKFCGECGSSMEKSGKCPSCGFENDPGMKFCGNCGSKL
jgi:hypothetical protein